MGIQVLKSISSFQGWLVGDFVPGSVSGTNHGVHREGHHTRCGWSAHLGSDGINREILGGQRRLRADTGFTKTSKGRMEISDLYGS